MPRHKTKTSFVRGHKRTVESIEKQRQTMKHQYETGVRIPPRKPKGTKDFYKVKTCESCEESYTPTAGKQRWCQICVPDGKARAIIRRYGLSATTVQQLIEKQGGHCALCDNSPLVVDHEHRSGRIRGVLCFSCNLKLSGLDDLVWKTRAEVYCAIR